MGLATINFALFRQGTEEQKQSAAAALVASFLQCGFVRLVNHGISISMIKEAEQWNRAFFRQEPKLRNAVLNMPGRNPQRGWSHKGAESTARLNNAGNAHLTDEKENFDVGPPDDFEFPNKWMEDKLPGFQTFSERFYHECQQLCIDIMAACEQGCHIPPGTLMERCKPAASELRYNYYPPVTLGRLYEGRTRRGWPHTDFGLITLLFQDMQGGLQYQNRDQPDQFLPLQRETAEEIAVNVSDTLQRWSNDTILAGIHQVWLPPNLSPEELDTHSHTLPERRSTVFFFKAHRDANVGALSPFINEAQPSRYDNITALEFHKRMTGLLTQGAESVSS